MLHIALTLALLLLTAQAASAAYCAMYFNGTRSCGIPSLAMCRQATTGVGGTCQQDFTDQIPPNMVQRMRADSRSLRQERLPTGPGSAGPFKPVTTSPCMSLSGDTCSAPNYLH
jgi:hypothetical protein